MNLMATIYLVYYQNTVHGIIWGYIDTSNINIHIKDNFAIIFTNLEDIFAKLDE